MPRPDVFPMTAQELVELARLAYEGLFYPKEEKDDEEDFGWFGSPAEKDYYRRRSVAIDALRFVAAATPSVGAVGALPIMTQAVQALDRDGGRDHLPHGWMFVDCLKGLAPLLEEVTEDLVALAQYPEDMLREALAEGLRPFDDAAVGLLNGLAADHDPEVRAKARHSLGPKRTLPWWWGLFDDDPLWGLAGDEATSLRRRIDVALPLMERKRFGFWKDTEDPDQIVAPLDGLPDDIAVALLERLLRRSHLREPHIAHWTAKLVARVGSGGALWRLCSCWSSYHYGTNRAEVAVTALDGVPVERCLAAARHLLAEVAEVPREAWTAPDHPRSREAKLGATLIAAIWPAGEAVTPVLEVILGAPLTDAADRPVPLGEYFHCGLDDLFERKEIDVGPLLPFLAEAHLKGYPGSWSRTPYALKERLKQVRYPALRQAALAALEAEDPTAFSWALSYLTGPGGDPEADPPERELLYDLYQRHVSRRMLMQLDSWRARILPWARADLRAGRLDADDAVSTLRAVDSVYGGAAPTMWSGDSRHAEEYRQKKREALAEWLGPSELQGAITDEEWEILRALRDKPAEGEGAKIPIDLIPVGPWHPADLAYLRLVQGVAEKKGWSTAVPIMAVLVNKPSPESEELALELARGILERADSKEIGYCISAANVGQVPKRAADLVRDAIRALRPPPPAPVTDWLDEPDE